MNFGLISEGHTDHKILKNILIGFFGEDIEESIQFLQPVGGARGGWQKVIEYCQSGNISGDMEQNDFIILQIDTDRLHEIG